MPNADASRRALSSGPPKVFSEYWGLRLPLVQQDELALRVLGVLFTKGWSISEAELISILADPDDPFSAVDIAEKVEAFARRGTLRRGNGRLHVEA